MRGKGVPCPHLGSWAGEFQSVDRVLGCSWVLVKVLNLSYHSRDLS